MASTSLVRVTERESGFFCDFEEMLARLVPSRRGKRERLILGLLGARTEQIPFTDGRLTLGQWQRVLLFGFNGDARAGYDLTLDRLTMRKAVVAALVLFFALATGGGRAGPSGHVLVLNDDVGSISASGGSVAIHSATG